MKYFRFFQNTCAVIPPDLSITEIPVEVSYLPCHDPGIARVYIALLEGLLCGKSSERRKGRKEGREYIKCTLKISPQNEVEVEEEERNA